MGLAVSTDIPDEFMQLAALYAQPIRRQTSVEYLADKPAARERT
jgi:hypothetical protein